jgi:hypothetical protein
MAEIEFTGVARSALLIVLELRRYYRTEARTGPTLAENIECPPNT